MTNFMVSIKNNQSLFKKIAIILALIAFFIYATKFFDKKPNSTQIGVGTSTIYAQIANSENKRSLGLSYTEKIDSNAGMLFVFDDEDARNFWMRDMLFDIDIIWLDKDKLVNGFFENVSKDSYNKKSPELSKIYHSPENTKYVLEVNAGTITNLKIKVGDKLDFKY